MSNSMVPFDRPFQELRYWSDFLPRLAKKAVDEALNAVYFQNEPLNRWLRTRLSGGLASDRADFDPSRSLLAEPVFAAMYPSKPGPHTYDWMVKQDLLKERTVRILTESDHKIDRPYAHQFEAIRLLGDRTCRRSAIISSGTGSGKTECFMVPLLDDLVREIDLGTKPKGIRALFIYPLNALIESQQERLSEWTKPFDGRVTFVRYNGDLPENPQSNRNAGPHGFEHPEELRDRKSMRETVPDIMLSNSSMLERMLLRNEDQPMLAATRKAKSFRWIVIDEAHTYVGAKAAELALLLRRIISAFGVEPNDVHFVLTSATVDAGDEEAKAKLVTFLRDLSGADEKHCHLILGSVDKPTPVPTAGLSEVADPNLFLGNLPKDGSLKEYLHQALLGSAPAMRIRNEFIRQEHLRLTDVMKLIPTTDPHHALLWLDLLSAPYKDEQGRPGLLPLRLHQMLNSSGPLLVCPDPECPDRDPELRDKNWRFGQIWTDERRTCSCGAPLFPLVACGYCSSVALSGRIIPDADGFDTVVPANDMNLAAKRWDEREIAVSEGVDADGNTTLDSEAAGCDSQAAEAQKAFQSESAPESDAKGEIWEKAKDSSDLTTAFRPVLITNEPDPNYEEGAGECTIMRQVADDDGCSVTQREISVICREETDSGSHRLTCPTCSSSLSRNRWYLRRITNRYAQYLYPYILQYGDGTDSTRPMNGSRLISFTDSRDGTAMNGALLEREGEHAFLCSSLLHQLRQLNKGSDAVAVQREEIQQLLASPKTSTLVRELLIDKLKELGQRSLPWKDLVSCIESVLPDDSQCIGKFAHLMHGFKAVKAERDDIAQIIVLRQFRARPINGANLETCGLVSVVYPDIEKQIKEAPTLWPKSLGLKGWQTFLTHFVDFVIRGNLYVELPSKWHEAGGDRYATSKTVMRPNAKEQIGYAKPWPQVLRKSPERSARIVRYLAALVGVDLASASHDALQDIDQLLANAFSDLKRINILHSPSQGEYLMKLMEKAAFRLNRTAWAFPGVNSVFAEIVGEPDKAVCPIRPEIVGATQVSIPEPLENNGLGTGISVREWIESSVAEKRSYRDLINLGAWNRFGTYALMEYGYFAAAEHSGQIGTSVRSAYTSRFKKGNINILSCTTTMEMGVDIGGIRTVFMNGVPPHPANYLQRAGRAGRRNETRANAFTFCRSTTRDREVFASPDWALTERQTSMGISLQSPSLVTRHVNAQIFGTWCLDADIDTERLTIGEWIGQPSVQGSRIPKRSTAFEAWCGSMSEGCRKELEASLRSIVRYSVLEGRSLDDHLKTTKEAIAKFEKDWTEKHIQFVELLKKLQDKEPTAHGAVLKQARRHLETRLYDELTAGNFFPESVRIINQITFRNKTTNEEEQEEKARGAKKAPVSLPSRSARYGIHEYAPGASVLIDGRIYESSGLTLNWHKPPTVDGIKEIQQITRVCRCPSCGHKFTIGSEHSHPACPVCGTSLTADDMHKAIVPAGFTVSDQKKSHNDLSGRVTYPKIEPAVGIATDWTPLGSGSGIRWKASPSAEVLNCNTGINRQGFAVCLCCGWAAPEVNEPNETDDFEKRLRRHYPVRNGLTVKNSDGSCPGGDGSKAYMMQRHLFLSSVSKTDALILEFDAIDGLKRADGTEIDLRGAATGVAVALRRAIAHHFLIDEREIDFAVSISRNTLEIALYDVSPCGYTSTVVADLPKLLNEAYGYLEKCPNGCKEACSACVVSYDAPWHSPALNRHDSMVLLSKNRLAGLRIEDKLSSLAGSSTAHLNFDPISYVESRARYGALRSARFFVHGHPDAEMPVRLTPIVALASKVAQHDVPTTIVSVGFDWTDLDGEALTELALLMPKIRLAQLLDSDPALPVDTLAVELEMRSETRSGIYEAIAVEHPESLSGWTLGAVDQPIYRGYPSRPVKAVGVEEAIIRRFAGQRLADSETEAQPAPLCARILPFALSDLRSDNWGLLLLNGAAQALKHTSFVNLVGDAKICHVLYTDRYVARVFDLALLTSLFRTVADTLPLEEDAKFVIRTMPVSADRYATGRITDFWVSDGRRDSIIDAVNEAIGKNLVPGRTSDRPFRIRLQTDGKNGVPHFRRLTMSLSDGRKIVFGFERGVSYLSPEVGSRINQTDTQDTVRRLLRLLDWSGNESGGKLVYREDEAEITVWVETPHL